MTADHVTVRHGLDESLDDKRHDTVNLDDGACEINLVLDGKIVIQIMVSEDRQYTIFDAEYDGVL